MSLNLIPGRYLTDIETRGYAVIENMFDTTLTNALMQDCYRINPNFKLAGIGRQQDLQIDGTSQAQIDYQAALEDIRINLNRYFFLGLFDYECHYAKYQLGDFYKKHYDAFKGRSNRVFTTVFYLNTVQSGGELVIYKPKSKDIEITIRPTAGTLVMFESERFMHEVLPTVDNRYSVAGWFRKNTSISGVIDPPR